MTPYANTDGESGIVAYDVDDTSITVQFKDGSKYLYTDASAGALHVSAMQELAGRGSGLNAYINRHVKYKYAKRF